MGRKGTVEDDAGVSKRSKGDDTDTDTDTDADVEEDEMTEEEETIDGDEAMEEEIGSTVTKQQGVFGM